MRECTNARTQECRLRIVPLGGFAFLASCILAFLLVTPAFAQTGLAVLQAEDRRAPTAADLATIRAGSRSGDPQVARVGVRALGRLERPALVADILVLFRHPLAEVRAEAANAVGQAGQGWKRERPTGAAVDSTLTALIARLKTDADPDVRAALAETIGRLPYPEAAQAEKAEQALTEFAAGAESVTDRLGAAKGFEALTRVSRKLREPGPAAVESVKALVMLRPAEPVSGARIRRLALEALLSANAVDQDLAARTFTDPDPQVRRLALRVVAIPSLAAAVHDPAPMVRLEALRQLTARKADAACALALEGVGDRATQVALVAIDQLGGCGSTDEAVAALDRIVHDLTDVSNPRGWHRPAHAVVALASASPGRAAPVVSPLAASRTWQLRMYAARAAAILHDRAALERAAADDDDNVREVAVEGLQRLFAHDADAIYLAQLTRNGNQVLRAAAAALAGAPDRDAAVPALKATLDRLTAAGSDNSHDARDAIAKTLASLTDGAAKGRKDRTPPAGPRGVREASDELNADDLRRLASPRARLTVRGVGTFELALFTSQAPATVLRFARLAQAGYYNGLTFHRIVPNFVIQGGSPGANEYIGDSPFMRDELGLWPHVRGAVGISTRGRDTGDAQIFVDLVDNPRLDHEYTVFAQVLNGIEVVDQILEGDVIEKVEVIPGS
jgi:cyclophilin family peptidyl-prolyl cis-trans isomerase/HEAT repeat protein